MKKFSGKKITSLIIGLTVIVTTLLSFPATAHAVETPTTLESSEVHFWADPENAITTEDIESFNQGTATTMVGAVSLFKRSSSSTNYYMFLPSNADCNNLKVWFNATNATIAADGSTDAITLTSGTATDAFSAINDGGVSSKYTLTLDSNTYTVTAIKSGDVGTVFVDTTSGSMKTVNSSSDHTAYEDGTIMVLDADGNVEYDGTLEKIQGRGNGTWSTSNTKNPYNIKLATSTSLLGMSKAKKWCLLANVNDDTLIKNQLTYDFADYIGVKYQPHCKPVDLYVNQQYYGSYQLAEKVEIKSNRIDISDAYEDMEIANGTTDENGITTPLDFSNYSVNIEAATSSGISTAGNTDTFGMTLGARKYATTYADKNSVIAGGTAVTGTTIKDPTDYTGGYLYELEISNRWYEENAGFCAYNRQGWVMKSTDYATKNMVNYSYNLLYALGSSVYNGGTVPSKSTTTSCSGLSSASVLVYGAKSVTNPAPDTQYQGKKWSDILDADSAVRYYWTQEYFKNMDSATSSTYFYKDSDSIDDKLYAGPMWDMDNSIGYNSTGTRWGMTWTDAEGWYTKSARIYRWRAADATTTYSSDTQAPLNFYAALATNCTDFWQMAQAYWYSTIEPATQILLGNETDSTGTLKSTEYYVKTVAKSSAMNNLRLNLNNDVAYDTDAMVAGVNSWFTKRNTWIDTQFEKVDINKASVTVPVATCTGSEVKPTVTVTYNGMTLTEGNDYTVEYSNNIAASDSATVTITGKGLFTGTKAQNFTISAGTLNGGTATIDNSAYAGTKLSVAVKNADGISIDKYITYQWNADGEAISGATDAEYTLTDAEKGKAITVTVTGDGSNIDTNAITSNACNVSTEDKPTGYTKTIASWNYDYTNAADTLTNACTDVDADTGKATAHYYTATSGEKSVSSKLIASVNAVDDCKIKWSGTDDLYTNGTVVDQAPVMGTSKTDSLAWGQYPYFETVTSTKGYENITFSAKLGGTKKAPRDWKLQYSLDGSTFTDVEGATYSITANKTLENAFTNVTLPDECNNQSTLYIRVVANNNIAINGTNTIIGQTSGDAAVNDITICGSSTAVVTELSTPVITTTSTNSDNTKLFSTDKISIADTNGGADVYYTVNDGDPILYTGEFNPFDSKSAKENDTATIKAWSSFTDIKSDVATINVTFGGVNLIQFAFDDYSSNVSNGAVFSNGGVYDESGKMTAYTDGKSQYTPYWKASSGAFLLAPDDGALWSAESGYYFEVPTAGYEDINFTCKAYTTNQGPKSVTLQYSLTGETWVDVKTNIPLSANGTLEQLLLGCDLPDACNNRAKVYLRLVTAENSTFAGDKLHSNNSKGNLYINNVVISGEDTGDYKMPYTNKTTSYFGTGTIKYYSPDNQAMKYTVTDDENNIILSGTYDENGIDIYNSTGFNTKSKGCYTVSIWSGDSDDKSVINNRRYYYKGDTVVKFNYNDTKKLLTSYLNADSTEATNTSGANSGTLSMYPNGTTATTLSYTNTYGVKVSYSADNAFAATKNLDNPSGNGYWLIKTSSKGYSDLTLNLEQLSSNYGPRNWGIAYSTNGSKYTYVDNSNVCTISNDSATSTVETYNNLALPADCDNQDTLYIKVFINGGESVNGEELETALKGNTGINAIELSGVQMPVTNNVTITTVAQEDANGAVGTTAVSSTITVDGTEYTANDGTVTVALTEGETYTVAATAYGTFVNTINYTYDGTSSSITIPVVAVDVVSDGVINAKDYAKINKMQDESKIYYKNMFKNFVNVNQNNFKY